MTCKDIQAMIPDILRDPGKYPEAEAHIEHCSACREELNFIQSLEQGLESAYPALTLWDAVPQRLKIMRKIRRKAIQRYIVYPAAVAATIMLTLLFSPLFQSGSDAGELYTYYETETLEAMMSIELPHISQISDEEIAAYLFENESLNILNELTF